MKSHSRDVNSGWQFRAIDIELMLAGIENLSDKEVPCDFRILNSTSSIVMKLHYSIRHWKGMPHVYISKIESGQISIGIDNLAKIAKVLGVKPGLLLEPEAYRQEK